LAGRRPRPEPDAYTRAVGLLARREHSGRELRRKLDARGVEPDEAEAALRRLAEQGYQDDARFADMLVRSRIGAGQGPQRIRAELGTHGIDDSAVEAAFDENPVDWTEEARRVVQRRYRPDELADPLRRRKVIEFLLRRGFELDVARTATLPAPADDL
jgi:regulatory protein